MSKSFRFSPQAASEPTAKESGQNNVASFNSPEGTGAISPRFQPVSTWGQNWKKLIEAPDVDQTLVQSAALSIVDVTAEQIHFLWFAAENIDPVKTFKVSAFQKRQVVAEHHCGGALVSIK